MKLTDNRAFTLEIRGERIDLSFSEAQELYDLLGDVIGIRRHRPKIEPNPYNPYPWGQPWRRPEIWHGTSGGMTITNNTRELEDNDG